MNETINPLGDRVGLPTAGESHAAVGESADIRTAGEVLRRAKAELKKAQEFYEQVRHRATEQVRAVRQKTVGDLIDGAIDVVRKHPLPGLLAAALAGMVLGRWSKR